MSKKQENQEQEVVLDFRAKALELTKANVSKGRTARGGTYLQAFVDLLDGKTEEEAMTRIEITAVISGDMVQAKYESDGGFDFENAEHVEDFAVINKKVKNQVSGAISNSKNNTSMSFNPAYNTKYELNKAQSNRGEVYWITRKEA